MRYVIVMETFHARQKMIRNVPLLQECSPEVVQELVLSLETRIFMPKDHIINVGEIGTEMYVV